MTTSSATADDYLDSHSGDMIAGVEIEKWSRDHHYVTVKDDLSSVT